MSVEVANQDEIGALAGRINELSGALRLVISGLQGSSHHSHEITLTLREAGEDALGALGSITAEISDTRTRNQMADQELNLRRSASSLEAMAQTLQSTVSASSEKLDEVSVLHDLALDGEREMTGTRVLITRITASTEGISEPPDHGR